MERFEVFRTKDPHVSTWLHQNGFQKRRFEGKQTTKCNQGETQPAAQTKEVRFYADRHMDIKNPTLISVKQTVPEIERTYKIERQSNGRLSNLTEMPPIGSSPVQRFIYQERAETLQDSGNICAKQQRIRSYSSPPNNRPTLSRRYSTQSLFSDRPSNIPVLIRNNDVRLRKYSCPEYYSTRTNLNYNEVKGSRELDTKGLARRTATNVSSNISQQLAKELGNQTTREQTEAKNKAILGVKSTESRPAKNGSALLKKEFYDLRGHISATDINGNEISPILNRQVSKSTPDDSDNGFGLEFYDEESLQSYSLEAVPKRPPKQTLPSSMYNTKSNMLTWLGEVNRSNPQFWS